MRAALVILLVSWIYTGCAGTRRSTDPASVPPRGGVLRLLARDERQAEAIRTVALTGRLAPDGLLVAETDGTAGENCAAFRIDGRAGNADGPPVDAESVVADWEADLGRAGSRAVWLLSPVVGAAAVTEGTARHAAGLAGSAGGRLVICSERPTPDWASRLAHPDLWLSEPASTTGGSGGPGPFERGASEEVLVAARGSGFDAPLVDRIEFVDPRDGDPASLFELDAIDLAIVTSREAGALLEATETDVEMRRLAAWDTVYALWLDQRARWVNDPRFRAWLADAIDRRSMLRLLFDGRGEPAYRLSSDAEAEWSAPATRPFSSGSTPRLRLVFDAVDSDAARIASRLKAVLEQRGLAIVLEPADAKALGEAIARGGSQLVLLAHHPPVEDPVLSLQHTLWDLGLADDASWDLLEQASWWPAVERRIEAASFAETTLLREARLVPLLRVHAWLATDPDLAGVEAGPWGVLRLDRAHWSR